MSLSIRVYVAADQKNEAVRELVESVSTQVTEMDAGKVIDVIWRPTTLSADGVMDDAEKDDAEWRATWQKTVAEDAVKVFKTLRAAKTAPKVVLVLPDGPDANAKSLSATLWEQGVGAKLTKNTVVLSPAYVDWLSAKEGASKPFWVSNLALTTATCTIVGTVEAAAAAIIKLGTPRVKKAPAPKSSKKATEDEDMNHVDDEDDEGAATAKVLGTKKSKKATESTTGKRPRTMPPSKKAKAKKHVPSDSEDSEDSDSASDESSEASDESSDESSEEEEKEEEEAPSKRHKAIKSKKSKQ